jgi:hypothetical protein
MAFCGRGCGFSKRAVDPPEPVADHPAMTRDVPTPPTVALYPIRGAATFGLAFAAFLLPVGGWALLLARELFPNGFGLGLGAFCAAVALALAIAIGRSSWRTRRLNGPGVSADGERLVDHRGDAAIAWRDVADVRVDDYRRRIVIARRAGGEQALSLDGLRYDASVLAVALGTFQRRADVSVPAAAP